MTGAEHAACRARRHADAEHAAESYLVLAAQYGELAAEAATLRELLSETLTLLNRALTREKHSRALLGRMLEELRALRPTVARDEAA